MIKNYTLYELLTKYKESGSSDENFNKFFYLFEPLLNKYAYKLGDIDYKYYLAEALYNALNKIPAQENQFKKNEYILSYIKKSIVAEYIKLSCELRKSELYFQDSVLENLSNKQGTGGDSFESYRLKYIYFQISIILSEKDFEIFMLKYYWGYTESEIAALYGITRQGINKKIKGIKKKIIEQSNLFI